MKSFSYTIYYVPMWLDVSKYSDNALLKIVRFFGKTLKHLCLRKSYF